MARGSRRLLGHLRGTDHAGAAALVTVSKAGREYWISHDGHSHLCHPSVRDIEGVKREAVLVFSVTKAAFEPL